MNIKKNEFIIGLVMITAGLMLIFGIFWLGNSNFFIKGLPINLKLENAYGIIKGDAIYFRGIKVGSVRNATISNNGVILNLKIEELDKIPIDSKFLIEDLSLIGGKKVEIIPGKSTKYLQKDDTVNATVGHNVSDILSEFSHLKPKIDKILDNTDTLTGHIMFNKISSTINELNSTIKDTRRFIDGELKTTVSSINNLTTENEGKISSLINSLNKNSAELSKFLNASTSTATALDSLIKSINKGKGSLGELAKNDSLYNNLNKTIISIDSLVTDIKQNPSKYINVSVF